MAKNLPAVKDDRSMLFETKSFEHIWRVGKMFAESTMVPEHFKGNPGNCVIALDFAERAGINPFMTMQKMYVIHGKPAIETQLAIALVNKTGRFTPLQYRFNDARDRCNAHAKNKETGEVCEGPPVSLQMAKDEGWTSKKGSKWKTLPDLMLRYRAAMFWTRVYCPEATLGFYTKEEVQDIVDVEPGENGTYIPVEPVEAETLADKVAKKKDAPEKVEPTISDDALASLEALKASHKDAYELCILDHGVPTTNDEALAFAEHFDAMVKTIG